MTPSTNTESIVSLHNVIKTYTPDLPGDFSGGLVDIHLREFPEQLTYSTSLSTIFNSQTTFQKFRTYQGGSLDYIGLGSNFRALPSRVPDTQIFTQLNEAQRDMFGRDFENIWNSSTTTAAIGSAHGITHTSSQIREILMWSTS